MTKIDATGMRAMLFTLLCFSLPAVQAGEWGLSELMQLLAKNTATKATFVEKKYIGIIDLPVESSGELAYTAPGKLVKRTLKPKLESLVLEGDHFTIEQPGKRLLKISLLKHPEVSAFIESIRGTLAGDHLALEKFYTLSLSGSEEEWKLSLIPKQAGMNTIISRIEISGSHADVKTINFEQGDGDRSEMSITKVSAE